MKKYIVTVYFKSGRVETIEGDNSPSTDELAQILECDSFSLTFNKGSLSIPTENIDYIKVEKKKEEEEE